MEGLKRSRVLLLFKQPWEAGLEKMLSGDGKAPGLC